MMERPGQISLQQWQERYERLKNDGLKESWYGGPLGRHVDDGDSRLCKLLFDNSAEALRLWNFLLTEEERLKRHRAEGKKIIGAMKDLGTVALMGHCFDGAVAFYPDGAWWIPCIMEHQAGLLNIADSLGIDESFCPVRAMLGAFVTGKHFPVPDVLVCSAGAVCDDFSVIAQRLEGMGHEILWWEIPHRRIPDCGEEAVEIAGGVPAVRHQVEFVRAELERVHAALEERIGERLDASKLAEGIRKANRVREVLGDLRRLGFTCEPCALGALEMLIAEMLAIHFCSDFDEALLVLEDLLGMVSRRVEQGVGVLAEGAAKIFWVNPVADLRAMNVLEDCGGRICGTEYLFSHALDPISEDVEPMEALARCAIADPMAGSTRQRAERIVRDIRRFGSEAVVISRIKGASHCGLEGKIIGEYVKNKLDVPVLEIEIPSIMDGVEAGIRTRLGALVETVKKRRET